MCLWGKICKILFAYQENKRDSVVECRFLIHKCRVDRSDINRRNTIFRKRTVTSSANLSQSTQSNIYGLCRVSNSLCHPWNLNFQRFTRAHTIYDFNYFSIPDLSLYGMQHHFEINRICYRCAAQENKNGCKIEVFSYPRLLLLVASHRNKQQTRSFVSNFFPLRSFV